MHREMKAMASDNVNLILKSSDMNILTTFSWNLLIQELTVHAPTLLSILTSITTTLTPRENQTAIIGMCTAMLLKHRYERMSLVQKLLSTILYSGSASKQVQSISSPEAQRPQFIQTLCPMEYILIEQRVCKLWSLGKLTVVYTHSPMYIIMYVHTFLGSHSSPKTERLHVSQDVSSVD